MSRAYTPQVNATCQRPKYGFAVHNLHMKTLLVLVSLLFALNALSVEIKSAPNAKDGSRVLQIYGRIEFDQKYPKLKLREPTRIFITSKGGNPHGVEPMVKWLISEFGQTNHKPTVIFRRACESSCIGLLAAMNQLVRYGMIELILDSKTLLGFHGCSTNSVFNKECTAKFIKEHIRYGVKRSWISQNLYLYSYPKAGFIVQPKVRDPIFKNSNLFHYALIEDDTLKFK